MTQRHILALVISILPFAPLLWGIFWFWPPRARSMQNAFFRAVIGLLIALLIAWIAVFQLLVYRFLTGVRDDDSFAIAISVEWGVAICLGLKRYYGSRENRTQTSQSLATINVGELELAHSREMVRSPGKSRVFSLRSVPAWVGLLVSLAILSKVLRHPTAPQYQMIILITAGIFAGSLVGLIHIYNQK